MLWQLHLFLVGHREQIHHYHPRQEQGGEQQCALLHSKEDLLYLPFPCYSSYLYLSVEGCLPSLSHYNTGI
ncbi:hypothetical protein MUK42_29618 [Musa troglodytarum]|uniref:Uncharacterized protein n=1 Tax=Musa troglodytarum TaxID=320322 RepID=A0A9E7GCT4_9LILI|nr:hypothetical protein MUK42_29618 [Musa troglodytarum]